MGSYIRLMYFLLMLYVFFSYVFVAYKIGLTSDFDIFDGIGFMLAPFSTLIILAGEFDAKAFPKNS